MREVQLIAALVAGESFRHANPSGFPARPLLSALREADEELPDDAEALLRRGIPVAAVPVTPKTSRSHTPRTSCSLPASSKLGGGGKMREVQLIAAIVEGASPVL